jgi:hypothetical protein
LIDRANIRRIPLFAVAILCWLILTGLARGQIQQLPATAAGDEVITAPTVSLPEPELGLAPDLPLVSPSPAVDEHPEARDGVFQKLSLDGTWIPANGGAGLGFTDLALDTTLAVPCPTKEWPLLIVPAFATHYVTTGAGVDLPPRLYDASIEFRWLPKVTDRLRLDISATPGVYRDFDVSTDSGLRTTAYGAAIWDWTPQAKLVMGASYLERRDWNFIPIGGLLWTPYEDLDLELLFPAPKVAHRVYCFGQLDKVVQDWVYVAGEFADSNWAIQHSDGTRDQVAYRDVRVLLGMERKVIHGLGAKVEIGYVFSRKLVFYSGIPDVYPSGALLLRGGLTY